MRRSLLILLLAASLSACPGSAMDAAATRVAKGLQDGILNHDDVATVRDALPGYMLTLDGLVEASPDNPQVALAAAQLYAFFASNFASEPERKKRLAERARRYARQALCLELTALCETLGASFEEFAEEVEDIDDEEHVALLYGFTTAWAVWIQANVEDWNAIADVAKIETLLKKVIALKPRYEKGMPYVYLGVLASQLPEAMGGKPDKAREYFEEALTISGERNLMAQVYYARQYARMVFDRKLHDQLLREVVAADPRERGLTLSNILAQEQARTLLAESQDFF